MRNIISRPCDRRVLATLATASCLVAAGLVDAPPARTATSGASTALALTRTIQTTPFIDSKTYMKDNEASAFVPRDNSVWLADDGNRRLYEVSARTGRLKQIVGRRALESVRRAGGGRRAGKHRSRDLEALAYDAAHDRLYAFSGHCCKDTVRPTVFRLTRQNGRLRPASYQPLGRDRDYPAAAWNPDDSTVYVASGEYMRPYHYAKNRFGPRFHISEIHKPTGMDFSADGDRLFVTRTRARMYVVDWDDRTRLRTYRLRPFHVRDARAVSVVRDQLWVSDGYDDRLLSSPYRHAVFVFDQYN